MKNYIIKTNNFNYDEKSIKQLDEMSKVFNDNNIIIMPDYHAGKGCVVGTTMEIKNKVCPNHVGVDICCGVTGYFISNNNFDESKIPILDNLLREGKMIPSGKSVRQNAHVDAHLFKTNSPRILNIMTERDIRSLGTLGGGNHFIEIDKVKNGYWVFVHSGSRNLGLRIAKYHQDIAVYRCSLRESLKRENLRKSIIITTDKCNIQKELECLNFERLDKENSYLKNIDMENYLYDVKEMFNYALLNRTIMIKSILEVLEIPFDSSFLHNCTHNFIQDKILRKGAIPSYKGQMVFIPLNMKDGVIIGEGKSNKEWNCSAPHGAGRLFSRGFAKKNLNMEDFKSDMDGIYSSSVNLSTLDECPKAYKPKEEILSIIEETVEIREIAKPIYNFKAND